MNILNRISELFTKVQPLPEGAHNLRAAPEREKPYRLHLRLLKDGTGILVVNAATVLHLNPNAAECAYHFIKGSSPDEAARQIAARYRVSKDTALKDFTDFADRIQTLIETPDLDPVSYLDFERVAPHSADLPAPLRLDCALTYKLPEGGQAEYAPVKQVQRELSAEEWQTVLDKAWRAGIPHIVFTGGEATLRNDLPDLIRHAEANGQITGLNTNARRLMDMDYVNQLVDAGLDHVQITVESCVPEIHDEMMRAKGAFRQTIAGVNNVLRSPLYVMTNTTMLRTNVHTIPATLDFLADLGVPTIGLNALIYSGSGLTVGTGLKESELQPILDVATQKTNQRGQRLIWYTPTQYCEFDPTANNLGVKGCTAALYSMCIESNGNVLPCQSYYHPLGNMLEDSWDSIWNHPLSIQLRERQNLPAKCEGCPVVAECGGGCPLTAEGYRKENFVDLPVVH